MYIIQEMQTNAEGVVAFLPPVQKATRLEAESEYHIKAGYAAISSVPVHTVMCYTEEGFEVLPPVVYKHSVQPAPEPEPEPEVEAEPENTGLFGEG